MPFHSSRYAGRLEGLALCGDEPKRNSASPCDPLPRPSALLGLLGCQIAVLLTAFTSGYEGATGLRCKSIVAVRLRLMRTVQAREFLLAFLREFTVKCKVIYPHLMCGRYSRVGDKQAIAKHFHAEALGDDLIYTAEYNIAPTTM